MTYDFLPRWLSKEQVLWIHKKTIDLQGGLHGIRDENLLESALSRPRNLYFYEQESDTFTLAAAYVEGLARGHPFFDGNKRTAYIVAAIFLKGHGYNLLVKVEEEQVAFFERFAAGDIKRAELADFYRQNTTKVEGDG